MPIPPNLAKIRDKLAKVMQVSIVISTDSRSCPHHLQNEINKLHNGELRHGIDPVTAKPFTFKSAMDRLSAQQRQNSGNQGGQGRPANGYWGLMNLHKLSQAMGYLVRNQMAIS